HGLPDRARASASRARSDGGMNGHDHLVCTAARDVFDGREFAFTARDFQRIAEIFREDAGIVLPEIKAPLVYSRLVKRLRALRIESFQRYCAFVDSSEGTAE